MKPPPPTRVTRATIVAMRRRAALWRNSGNWARNSLTAALREAAADVDRLCNEIERTR